MSTDITTLAKTSDEAVTRATGFNWQYWMQFLDRLNGRDLNHKQIVAVLKAENVSPWWCQKIANTYERFTGKSAIGKTSDVGFEIGVSRTIEVSPEELWTFLTSPQGYMEWLGDTLPAGFESKHSGFGHAAYSVTVFRPLSHIRMTWKPDKYLQKTTLQIRVEGKGRKTVLSFHQEKLPDAKAREEAKIYWTNVAERIKSQLNKNSDTTK